MKYLVYTTVDDIYTLCDGIYLVNATTKEDAEEKVKPLLEYDDEYVFAAYIVDESKEIDVIQRLQEE